MSTYLVHTPKPLAQLNTKFGCIVADCPWPEVGGGKIKRGADRHYPVMTVAQICALPVPSIAADDSHLYLWITNNFLAKGAGQIVARAWGFEPVTVLSWFKPGNPGLGQYFRGTSEHVLFCKRGQPSYRFNPISDKRAQGLTGFEWSDLENALYAGQYFEEYRLGHSVKPSRIQEWAELVSHGPYLEMFARRERAGWYVWGNQI